MPIEYTRAHKANQDRFVDISKNIKKIFEVVDKNYLQPPMSQRKKDVIMDKKKRIMQRFGTVILNQTRDVNSLLEPIHEVGSGFND